MATFGNLHRGTQRIRPFGEQNSHLSRGTEGVLGIAAQQAARLLQRGAMPDAGQQVVQGGLARFEVMHVAGSHQAQARATPQLAQAGVQATVAPFVMALQLKEEVVAPEDGGQLLCYPLCSGHIPVGEGTCNLAAPAAG